jgi:putative transposase
MRENCVRVYVHLVWATWDRLPLLTDDCRKMIYSCLQAECRRLKAELLALGGVEDHVHLLVTMPSPLSIADLVKQLKGSSSHLISHQSSLANFFKWQGSYGAFSISEEDVSSVQSYIANQAKHHQDGTWDQTLELNS